MGIDQHITSWIAIFAAVALLAPLVSAVVAACMPNKYQGFLSFTAPLCVFGSVVSAVLLLVYGWDTEPYLFSIPWFRLAGQPISAGIQVDNLALLMVFIVSVISFLVHVYSTGYMKGDKAYKRYFVMLGFFTFAMMGVVLADNLLLLFVFWEIVGFASFMLIGHYTEKVSAGMAAKKAFIMNRIGDLGFLIGIMIIWSQTNTFQLFFLQSADPFQWQTAAALCLFAGIIGKSAQFPLLTWLPDAMTGPTPVSALIHAATMVAAGVFLLARVLFLFPPIALDVVVLIGVITSAMAAIAALVQYDIKKILAYSTVSQLGFMVMAMGTGTAESGMLHLFTHAFFKAGLFLAAGSVIHAMTHALHDNEQNIDPQDIRNISRLHKRMPVTFITLVVCGASLSGIPLFSGFQSKESIIASLLTWSTNGATWRYGIVAMAFIISFCTVAYTFRMIWYVALRKPVKVTSIHLSESPLVMLVPMLVLSAASFWWVVSWNPLSMSGWYHTFSGAHAGLTLFSMAWIGLALGASVLYYRKRILHEHRSAGFTVLKNFFYIDVIYKSVFVDSFVRAADGAAWMDKKIWDGLLHLLVHVQVAIAYFIAWIDRIVVDGSVNGVARMTSTVGSFTRSFQGGKVQLYIFWTALMLLVFLFALLF